MTKCNKCGKEMDDLEVKLDACHKDGKVFCKKCCEEETSPPKKSPPPKKEKKKGDEDDDDSILPLGEEGKKNKPKTSSINGNKNNTIYWVLGIGAAAIILGIIIFWLIKKNKRKEEGEG